MIQEIRKSEIFNIRGSVKNQKQDVKQIEFGNFENFVKSINLERNYDKKSNEFDELMYCTICHKDISLKRSTIIKCSYCDSQYHSTCITSWLLKYNSCPMCLNVFLIPNLAKH